MAALLGEERALAVASAGTRAQDATARFCATLRPHVWWRRKAAACQRCPLRPAAGQEARGLCRDGTEAWRSRRGCPDSRPRRCSGTVLHRCFALACISQRPRPCIPAGMRRAIASRGRSRRESDNLPSGTRHGGFDWIQVRRYGPSGQSGRRTNPRARGRAGDQRGAGRAARRARAQ